MPKRRPPSANAGCRLQGFLESTHPQLYLSEIKWVPDQSSIEQSPCLWRLIGMGRIAGKSYQRESLTW